MTNIYLMAARYSITDGDLLAARRLLAIALSQSNKEQDLYVCGRILAALSWLRRVPCE